MKVNLGFWRVLFITLSAIGLLFTGMYGYDALYAGTGAVMFAWVMFELLVISNMAIQIISGLNMIWQLMNPQPKQPDNKKVN